MHTIISSYTHKDFVEFMVTKHKVLEQKAEKRRAYILIFQLVTAM